MDRGGQGGGTEALGQRDFFCCFLFVFDHEEFLFKMMMYFVEAGKIEDW